MNPFYETAYDNYPKDLNKHCEFLFSNNSKMKMIEPAETSLIDIYPYPEEFKDYPPYWKFLEEVNLRDDNIGKSF